MNPFDAWFNVIVGGSIAVILALSCGFDAIFDATGFTVVVFGVVAATVLVVVFVDDFVLVRPFVDVLVDDFVDVFVTVVPSADIVEDLTDDFVWLVGVFVFPALPDVDGREACCVGTGGFPCESAYTGVIVSAAADTNPRTVIVKRIGSPLLTQLRRKACAGWKERKQAEYLA